MKVKKWLITFWKETIDLFRFMGGHVIFIILIFVFCYLFRWRKD